jgi:molybdopterin-dependent oxidoreductase alpha subunit
VPGSDTAVFVGLQKALLELDAVPLAFVQAHSEGWEAVVEQARSTSWAAICGCCGLSREELTAAARVIAAAKGVVFAWAMGITHHSNGTDNVRAIANTAVLSGNVGRPGAGTMPIRGHSNVQGAGSMGVTVKLRDDLRQALEQLLGRPLSRVPGYDTRALIEAADGGHVDTLLCLGGNLFSANPDQTQARRALGRIDTILYLATKPNLGHFHGLAARQTLLLPVFNRLEMPHTTTVESGNNFVRLNDRGQTHLLDAELISEVTFLAELAGRLLGSEPIDWRGLQDTAYVRQLIARTVPGYARLAAIEQPDGEFTVEGRVFLEPHFPTPSGRAQLAPTPLPDLSLPPPTALGGLEPGQAGLVLSLITVRSYGQHNTVVYQEGDRYREMPHRQCILMNRGDIVRAGLRAHQRVAVQGEAGVMEGIEIIPGAVKEGAGLMFYPEVNVLMRGHRDPQSGTPAYKRVPVLVRG